MTYNTQHKVFISYHHANDQWYKNRLIEIGNGVFIDASVDTGDISEEMSDQAIREKIRDDYLKDSTVTIVLVGTDTKYRKHVDWEIYSSMHDGKINKKSGILVINLPSIQQDSRIYVGHGEHSIYPASWQWQAFSEDSQPYLPERVLDNLKHGAKISVTSWNIIEHNPYMLRDLIEITYRDRASCDYALSPMMRGNTSSQHIQGFEGIRF